MAEREPESTTVGDESRPIDLLYPFYLDADMSMAFSAALTGGVAFEEEQVDRSSDTSKAVKAIRGNLKLWRAGGLEGRREATEALDATSESRLVKRHSDASIFIALYDELRRTGQLHMNPAFEDLSIRDLVALDMGPAVAPLRRVVDQVIRLIDLNASALGLETEAKDNDGAPDRRRQRPPRQHTDPETAEAIRLLRQLRALFKALSDDLEHSGMIDIVVDRGELPNAVLTLDKRFVSTPTLELLHTSRFTVVGKVSQIWPDDTEFVNLYRRSVLALVPALAQSTAWGLLAMLGAMGRGFDVDAMRRSTAEALGLPPEGAEQAADSAGSAEAQPAAGQGSEGETSAEPEQQPSETSAKSEQQPEAPPSEVFINTEAAAAILPGISGPAFQLLPLAICS